MFTILIPIFLLLGVFLVVAEIVLIPGITIAAVGAAIFYLAAIVLGFIEYGFWGALIVILISLVLSIIALMICSNRKYLKKISLDNKIESKSSKLAKDLVSVGDQGIAVTRLAPMGKVVINGYTLEAKSSVGYVSERSSIKVIALEDSVVIVEFC